jgi:hypothetical protein
MADRNPSDDAPVDKLAREQTLARLMEAAAVLAATRIEPGSRFDDIESAYRSCLSIVMDKYLRLIECGFTDDPGQAAKSYAAKIRSITRFAPT